ncbi:Alpha/Beta hydrolase protein [Pseudomassariella vexata]|uniref:Carboxylic ester hydrolase n=1 Tax=Pseudomassariella vexata TaxID=1141098 RepID=A0A1Y2D6K6_9PEZI|nr:Alpha/Beta hydrolase protein [Pseudomassariella vexata]ORY54941.1 Alpha/Beta hydrolase protein [Pseudomassariella vexata]
MRFATLLSTIILLRPSRAVSYSLVSDPIIDLGYGRYQGVYNTTFDQNIFRGIRYATPPTGKLRWQLPQSPEVNRAQVTSAVENPPRCPQSYQAPPDETVDLDTDVLGNEDCLFLNVFTPANATQSPVLVWIHGGGYGAGSAKTYDFASQVHTNKNEYIAVVIQYRLGAFGFLSSAEVARSGVPNAGIHDMRFALEWVQKHIHVFGGDPGRVTIAGESAGGGSVMLLGMANGGSEGTSLFNGVIASSPYLPTQWKYDDILPSQSYYRLAQEAGCLTDQTASTVSIFDCLQTTDTLVLQNASNYISTTGLYGQWAFVPVTDDTLIQCRPTEQLAVKPRTNGIRLLTSNNLNEGPYFVPQTIETETDFLDWLRTTYPLLTPSTLTSVLSYYGLPENFDPSEPYVDSNGLNPPFSTTTSHFGIGWQQAANNLYAETTFVCPSYWLADAFSAQGGKAWKYQFSVPPACHGCDIEPFLNRTNIEGTGINEVLRTTMQRVWGNFVVNGDPGMSALQMADFNGSSESGDNLTAVGAGTWPLWSGGLGGAYGRNGMVNMNMTGGVQVVKEQTLNGQIWELTQYVPGEKDTDPPLEAKTQVVDADSWEGGRRERCRLWVELGPWIME